MIRLIMVPTEGAMPSESPYCNPDDTYCERSQQMIDTHYDELFSDTPRCIITLLRCFTDGCASVDGTPLIPTLFNIYGYPPLSSYIMFMFFITFGLFNLITAILVESTVDAAKADRARGLHVRRDEQRRLAAKLRAFMDRTLVVCSKSQRAGKLKLMWTGSLANSQGAMNSVKSLFSYNSTQPKMEDIMGDFMDAGIDADMFS